MTGTSATTPASANSRATSPTRRMFSLRSAAENPRSALSPWRRLSPSSRYAGRPTATSARSTSAGTVDFPDPDSPVNHTVAPAEGRSPRPTAPECQTTLSEAMGALGPDLGGPGHHPRRHRVVRRLVHEHEAAGGAVPPVLVVEQRHGGAQPHPP